MGKGEMVVKSDFTSKPSIYEVAPLFWRFSWCISSLKWVNSQTCPIYVIQCTLALHAQGQGACRKITGFFDTYESHVDAINLK